MKNFFEFLALIKKSLNGDFAYENYLAHHKGEKTLDKKSFLLKRQKEKWKKINRCC